MRRQPDLQRVLEGWRLGESVDIKGVLKSKARGERVVILGASRRDHCRAAQMTERQTELPAAQDPGVVSPLFRKAAPFARSAPWTLVLSSAVLISALIWPSYDWPPSLAGVALGALAAVIVYLSLVVRPELSIRADVERHRWWISLIAAIGTSVLVIVQRGAFGLGPGTTHRAGTLGPAVSLPLLLTLLFVLLLLVVSLVRPNGVKPAVVAGAAGATLLLVAGIMKVSPTFDVKFQLDRLDFNLPSLGPTPAPRPPGAPTTLTASPADGSATVSWSPPRSNGGSAITIYFVTSSPGGLTAIVPGRMTSATVTGLTNGRMYTFTVTAANAVGIAASGPSTPITPVTVPGVPMGVTASAGNGRATVTWAPPLSDGYAPIQYYIITPVTAGAVGPPKQVDWPATSATIGGLTNGAVYRFSVSAMNAQGLGPAGSSNAVLPDP